MSSPTKAATATPMRRPGLARAAAPIRIVHLGLGSFFRAHQAWYTDNAPDADGWGIAAFGGRGAEVADALSAQDGLYTLVTRAADADRFDAVASISRAHPGADHDAWLGYWAAAEVSVVTTTVTEAGYRRADDGALDQDDPEVRADIEALRGDLTTPVGTAPAKIVAGLAARRTADCGPLSIVPCDNLPDNGPAVARVVRQLADAVDPALGDWIADSVDWVTTMVDRITPRPASDLAETVLTATGRADRSPVVTEPYAEWVLSGAFRYGCPGWEQAGATLTDDVTQYEQRKLWLLNGAHSLLAYAGGCRGYQTVADAVGDEKCQLWLQEWWSEASRHLELPADDLAAYRDALLTRFANPRMQHRLEQIAADGSQKIPVRALPVLRRERQAGRVPAGTLRMVAAWIVNLRGSGLPVDDVDARVLQTKAEGPLTEVVPRMLTWLDPDLGEDLAVRSAVVDYADELST